MKPELERYLNDHLAGASGALILLQDLAERQEEESDTLFSLRLKQAVERDQALLKRLLASGEMEESKTMQVAGMIAAKAGHLKLQWEGLKPGGLGLFEALELLSLGIEGKRLLWVMLGEIAPELRGWQEVDFGKLEKEAIRQRVEVEKLRLEAGRRSFAPLLRN